ncbi:hypothetical protein GGR50DRAFT_402096 [Xylaria sp. CBS 124048]|nr:hypothetical protein GGR50DRAFT_402096 [Xylaria sp. CBS 124048]
MDTKSPTDVGSSLDNVSATNAAPAMPALPAVPAPAPAPSTEPGLSPMPQNMAPSPAPSPASPTGSQLYVPQFTPATQLIISRIDGTPGSLSAALSSVTSIARSIEKSAFEDAKRRLILSMNTSLTMPMPLTARRRYATVALPTSKGGSSHPRPQPSASAAASSAQAKSSPSKPASSKAKGKSTRDHKRKRGKDDDDAPTSSSELSDSDLEGSKTQMTATMTKSGRQVQKPTPFKPADASGSHKRKCYGKRDVEQVLCKVCTRSRGINKNQIVFCDGCNNCWHQMCHEPYIPDEFVSDEGRSWFCGHCSGKREKALARKKTLEEYKGVSWGSKSAAQKRDYLTDLPHAQLVNIVMYSTELHPELPIFPGQESGASAKRVAQGTRAGPASSGIAQKANAKVRGPANFHPSLVSTPDASDDHAKKDRESSVDSVPPGWPKVGQGVLAGINLDDEDLEDDDDYEAFSVTTYDSKGRKIMENGVPL